MDFTIKKYRELLNAFINQGFEISTFADFLKTKSPKTIIIRHDVDLLPENSLRFAKIQAELGIKGSYYFRAVPESWDEVIIKEIADLGHEVGYHYENMDTAFGKLKDKSLPAGMAGSKLVPGTKEYDKLIDMAYEDFCINLERLRKLVPVNTICMHGSPRSPFDNKEIWTKYNYKDLGLIGEPYYDVEFDKVFYLTDTGRRWDGWKTSVRDKVPQQEEWVKQGLVFHSTQDIIESLHIKEQETKNNEQRMPNQIMFTMHPQRWHDKKLPWFKELVMQNIKNQVKRVLLVK